MPSIFFKKPVHDDFVDTALFDQTNFYPAFEKDLGNCLYEAIIESPFITQRRLGLLLPTIQKLKDRKVRVVINTRDPQENDESVRAIAALQRIGVQVIFTGGHHRKLAIIDRQILWEGSLNILSQNDSCEVMRRIPSPQLAWQMACFINIDKLIN